jgi:hypothetical protein
MFQKDAVAVGAVVVVVAVACYLLNHYFDVYTKFSYQF